MLGEPKTGGPLDEGKALAKSCTVDLSLLDAAVDRYATKLLYTFPDCTRKTLESLRKKKLEHWYANAESSRSWLALNMNTEAAAGFAAFHYGDKEAREIDFVRFRRRLAEGAIFDAKLIARSARGGPRANESGPLRRRRWEARLPRAAPGKPTISFARARSRATAFSSW